MPKRPLPTIAPREGLARRLDAPMVVAAAAEIVDRDGLDELTLTHLARAAGVKTPSLCANISSLQSFRKLVAVFGLHDLERTIRRAAEGKSGPDAIRDRYVDQHWR